MLFHCDSFYKVVQMNPDNTSTSTGASDQDQTENNQSQVRELAPAAPPPQVDLQQVVLQL